MSKHRIGVTMRVTNALTYTEKRNSISYDLIDLICNLDCIPILIPNGLANVQEFLDVSEIDALILSGGDNIGDYPERDSMENSLISYSISKNLPVIGICRGMQVLNHYFNGILDSASTPHINHPHQLNIVNENFISILGNIVEVNSFHNNVINPEKLGKNLEPFAIAKQDNTVEGFFHTHYPFVGVMWHPERDDKSFDESLFKEIIQKGMFWNL